MGHMQAGAEPGVTETNQHTQETKSLLCLDASNDDDGGGGDAFITGSCLKSFNLKHFKICWCGRHMSVRRNGAELFLENVLWPSING